MPQGTIQKEIASEGKKETYEIHNLPTSRALKLASKLGSHLMGPISELLKALDTDAKPGTERSGVSLSEADIDVAKLGDALSRLSEKLGESDDVVYIFKELVSCTRVRVSGDAFLDMDDDLFEDHFAGRIGHLAKVALESLKHNYADFFVDLSALARKAGLARRLTTQAPPPSTGESGAPSSRGSRRGGK